MSNHHVCLILNMKENKTVLSKVDAWLDPSTWEAEKVGWELEVCLGCLGRHSFFFFKE